MPHLCTQSSCWIRGTIGHEPALVCCQQSMDLLSFLYLPIHRLALVLLPMRALHLLLFLALSHPTAFGQVSTTVPSFDVASIRPCQHLVGPDYNNQFTYSLSGITAGNATLKRLIAEAYHLQLNQVFGPGWISEREYDIKTRAAAFVTQEQLDLMLKSLLAERFKLKQHNEMRETRRNGLVAGKWRLHRCGRERYAGFTPRRTTAPRSQQRCTHCAD